MLVRQILIALAIGLSGPVADTSWIYSYYKQYRYGSFATFCSSLTHLPSYSAISYADLKLVHTWEKSSTNHQGASLKVIAMLMLIVTVVLVQNS